MPNKKINQLDVRTGAALTDLSLVGDPTSGTSFKLTLQDISTLMGVPGKFNQPTGTTAQYLRGDGSLATFPSLTGFVPYTGATSNVNLGEFGLATGQVTLDTSPTGTAAVGTTRWNDTFGGSETTLKGGSVVLKNGVDLVARIVNKVTPNTTLTKAAYQAVRVSGAQGQRLAVAFAQANNDANSADTIGLVCETIPTNQEGFIITMGQLENINTTGSLQGETWADGDVLYLSPTTPGAITKVKPTGAGHIVVIGYVEYAHVNNGKIYVKVMNGWELTELHDTDIVSPANNEALIYESSTALWKNKTIATALGFTPVPTTRTLTINGTAFDLSADRSWTIAAGITGSGVTGQVAYWNGTNSQTGSNNLFWDAANARLGIRNNTPSAVLDVVGNNVISDATNALKVIGGSTILKGNYTTSVGNNFAVTNFSNVVGLSVNGASQVFADNMLIGLGTTIVSTGAGYNFGITHDNSGITFSNNAGATRPYFFTIGGSERFRISNTFNSFPNGNLLVGGTTDGGQRLQVYGDAFVRGSGATSATSALLVQNTNGTLLFSTDNGGTTTVQGITNNDTSVLFRVRQQNTNTRFSVNALGQTFIGGDANAATDTLLRIERNFNPTSGTATHVTTLIIPTINQTGGANGITRGLYVNPTLTAAADWRSIEWSNNSGWGLYGAGTANNYLGGDLTFGNNKGFILSQAGTNKSGRIYAADIADNFAGYIFYPSSGTNVGNAFQVIPRGTGFNASIKSQIVVFNTDYVADSTNYELAVLRAGGTNYSLSTGKAGTGTTRPLLLSAGFATDAVTNGNQLWLYTSGRVGVNTTSESTFTFDVNGTARVSGDALVNGITVGKGNFNDSRNTALGFEALLNQQNNGVLNTAVGYRAGKNLSSTVTGFNSQNTFVGANAGLNHNTGENNTALGAGSLSASISGVGNTAIGRNSLASNLSDSNTAVGNNSGSGITTGYSNVAIGISTLTLCASAFQNTAVGSSSLQNTTGSNNSAFGDRTLNTATSGTYNSGFGQQSLFRLTTGGYNTAIGAISGFDLTTGSNNIFVGWEAGRFVGSGTTQNQTSSNSIYIGYSARASANGNTNELVIGYNAIGAGSNTATIGNTSITKTILRGTLNAANLPTSSAGLSAGDIWNDAGTLKIV